MQKLKAKVSKLSYISYFFSYTSPSEYHNQKLEIAISQQVIIPQDVATVQSLYLDNPGWE